MSVNIVVNADVQQAGKQIQDFSKQSRIALTSLSLVAQDLPFGFIGIQNNLPGVIQGFNGLRRETGSTLGAIKSLGSAMLGPSGLFFAFSAVTAAITFAVQKYGSLSAAIDAIFGKTTTLSLLYARTSKSLEEYNKNLVTNNEIVAQSKGSVSGQVEIVKTLAGVVLNLNESEKKRLAALQELKELDKDRFENYNLQAESLSALTAEVDKYTESLIANAVVEQFKDQVAASSIELNKQKNLLREISKGLPEATKKRKQFQETFGAEIFDPATGARISVADDLDEITTSINKQQEVVDGLQKNYDDLSESLKDAVTEALKFVKIKPPKPEKSEFDKYRGIISEFDYLSSGEVTTDVNKILNTVLANIRLNSINADDSLRLILGAQRRRRQEAEKELRTGFKKIPGKAPEILPGSAALESFQNLEKLKKRFAETTLILNETFFSPLSDLFTNFFDTGKFAFEEFGKAVLTAIKSLVAKIIATGIISLLANILVPGSGTIGATAAGAGAGRFGRNLVSLLGFGNVASPSFAGVGGGQLGFGGSVSLTLRGSDLVGALNRTNTTISRVG